MISFVFDFVFIGFFNFFMLFFRLDCCSWIIWLFIVLGLLALLINGLIYIIGILIVIAVVYLICQWFQRH